MGQLEVSSYSFALRSGVRQDSTDNAACIQPQEANLRRKGALALLVEPAGEHPSLADEACRLAQSVISSQYFADDSLSLTTSLLSALDGANRAVLENDYAQQGNSTNQAESGVAVQSGGVRTKGAKVGVTAVLFRPDGSGVYLAQLAPTQAYIVHNGLVQALPEPPGWNETAGDEASEQEEKEPARLHPTPLPAQSLGSKPGIVVDLIYRRVQAGDLIVLVSPGLARHLDRATAESIFLKRDAESVTEALYEIAEGHGLARAHASVIAIGVSNASSVSSEQGGRHLAPDTERVAANVGTSQAPSSALDALKSRLPALNLGASRPREWVERMRGGSDASQQEELPEPIILHKANDYANPTQEQAAGELDFDGQAETEEEFLQTPQYPTATLLQRTPEVPPYKQPTLLFAENDGEEEENLFDGWEDLPPALESPRYPVLQRMAAGAENAPSRPEARAYLQAVHPGTQTYNPTRVYDIQRPPAAPRAHIEFGDELLDDAAPSATLQATAQALPVNITRPHVTRPRINMPQIRRPHLHVNVSREHLDKGKTILQSGARWSATAMRNLLPERSVSPADRPWRETKRTLVPRRAVIAGALVLVLGVLLFSVFSGSKTHSQQPAVTNFLQEARQEDLLASQPGITDTERQTHLTTALDKVQKALLADPQSVDAKRLLTKVQTALDKAQGITRLKEPKLLFDLGKVAAQGAITTTNSASGAITLSAMVMQSDDVYLFDKAAGRVYKCKTAAQTCAPFISSGDSAGGQQVGTLVAMTMRVNSLLVLDDQLVAYLYNADTSAWQAMHLGNAADLQKPKDVTSYEGNLYLLDAKAGQISKYGSGAYESSPADWLQDPAAVEQVKEPVAIGVDGLIYVLLGDGKVLVMQGGKLVKTIAPTTSSTSPVTDLITGTDVSDLYLLRADGTITRVSKEGATLANLKPAEAQEASPLTGIAVDEGRGKVYLLKGQLVYEAILPGRITTPPDSTTSQQPNAQPTVEP
jgi:hypothetical protein